MSTAYIRLKINKHQQTPLGELNPITPLIALQKYLGQLHEEQQTVMHLTMSAYFRCEFDPAITNSKDQILAEPSEEQAIKIEKVPRVEVIMGCMSG